MKSNKNFLIVLVTFLVALSLPLGAYEKIKDYLSITTGSVEVRILNGASDPSLVGASAPVGSEYLRDNGDSYKKVGPSNFAWIRTNNTATPVGFELWEDPSFELGASDCVVTNGTKTHGTSVISAPSNLRATRIQIDAEEEMTYVCSKAVSANYAGTPIRHKGWLTLASAGTFTCSIVAQWNGVDVGNAQIITSDQNTYYDLEVIPTGAGDTGYKLTCNNPTTSFTRFIVHDNTSNRAEKLSPVLADVKRTQSEWLSFSSTITQTTDLSSLAVSNLKGSGIYSKSVDGFTFHQDADVVTNAYLYGSAATTGGSSIYLDGVTCNNATDGVTTSVARSLPVVCATHVKAGQKITFTLSNNGSGLGGRINILATATSPTIVMQNETFNSDINLGAWVAQAGSGDCSSSVVEGENNVGKWTTCSNNTASSNTRTRCVVHPTQTDSEAKSQGQRIFTRPYNSSSLSCATPSVFIYNIGRGFSGDPRTFISLYKNTSREFKGQTEFTLTDSGLTARSGLTYVTYNPITGILIVDAGASIGGSDTSATFRFPDTSIAGSSSQNNGYLVINASKNPVMSGVNAPSMQIVKDNLTGNPRYIVYDNCYVVQSGERGFGTTHQVITQTLPIPMANSSYLVMTQMSEIDVDSATTWRSVSARARTTTSFNFRVGVDYGKIWEVKGFASKTALQALGVDTSKCQ